MLTQRFEGALEHACKVRQQQQQQKLEQQQQQY